MSFKRSSGEGADAYFRINCKEGVFQEKVKKGDSFEVADTINTIGGILEKTELLQKTDDKGKEYWQFRMHFTDPDSGQTAVAYSKLNKAIVDLWNRLAGEPNPFGKDITVSIRPVTLDSGHSTANFYVSSGDERIEWKYESKKFLSIKNDPSRWVGMYNHDIGPRSDEHQKTLVDAVQTDYFSEKVSSTAEPVEEKAENDLPF